ncbi:acetyl-CoA carboxylase biotin carboxyl carrier protein [Candidatus Finniella inopinata]|uniref:Biotin carboxyl carrier protein of acetyl-CoA carboxylase n=1 Tax=Candidatus Finniella inopinata TaxID=1696036 RepID=A0A4Q7DHJ3_9PROT|nr:acetyl-CoA carboxylase biotin carboxyl carrier protein [Candidatus Finniella inopinata]RZI45758.1 acetyl-CoA carboxylase biotin carboxyl carrier protein [Candidatus Finniella inopinata]
MTATFKFDGEAVRKLAEILTETGLTEIEYEAGGNRIYVSRQQMTTAAVNHSVPSAHPVSVDAAPAAPAAVDPSQHPGTVRSPMVGTAYLSPEPSAPPFVKVGDTVSLGQTLLIVEAMKVMNPIKAPTSGKITHLFVKDASPVEYDEPLLVIE